MPRKPALPCGIWFCAASLRMLWPDRSIRLAEVGRVLGCTVPEVERRAHLLGLWDQRPHRQVFVYAPAAFRAAWADPSISQRAIAERFGMSPDVCSLHARRLGLPPRRGGPPRVRFGRAFAALWLAGVTTEVIAQHYDCSVESVRRHALRCGLPRRRRGSARLGAEDLRQILLREGLRAEAQRTGEALRLSEMVDPPNRVALQTVLRGRAE